MKTLHLCLSLLLATSTLACGTDEETMPADTNDGTLDVPETYTFESRFTPGASSVAYSGQTARQVLVADLTTTIADLQGAIEAETFSPAEDGDVVARLDFYFRFDGEADGDEPFLLGTTPGPAQETYNDISEGKDLVGKLAGNDPVTDHKDWGTEFTGWADADIAQFGGAITSPEGLVTAFFETLEENALGLANGDDRRGPGGEPLPLTVTEKGQDIQQLTQKFLGGALFFHQGADDYLDDDTEGKGLLSSNAQDGDNTYSALEHAWDEGFGYFGAARDYSAYTDEELSAKGGREGWSAGYYDSNGDGAIDLTSEFNFAASANAAKRDLGSSDAAPTDFTADTFGAFARGRAIIARAGDTLTEQELADLRKERDAALLGWERALAATVVHYINDTLRDMNAFGDEAYSFLDHAKHWSEMKGFALAFQFNPHSPLSDGDFDTFHSLVGDAPVLATAEAAEIAAYREDLIEARSLLGAAYGFDASNLGDEMGENGW